jgi:hypothetical protein
VQLLFGLEDRPQIGIRVHLSEVLGLAKISLRGAVRWIDSQMASAEE